MERVDWDEPVEWVSTGTLIASHLIHKERDRRSAYYSGLNVDDWAMKRPGGYYTEYGGYAGSESKFDRIRNSKPDPKDFEYDV